MFHGDFQNYLRLVNRRHDWSPSINHQRNQMDLITVYDCTGVALGSFPVPPGVKMAGYVTGTNGVPWAAAQFTQHPDAIRIDQSPVNTPADETADLADIEAGAVTIADAPNWATNALMHFKAGTRPGQRWPTLYVEESELTPVVNTLNAAGITGGVNLFLTQPMPEHVAIDKLNHTGGPFPLVGIQFAFMDDHDVSLVSKQWLDNVSVKQQGTAPKQLAQGGWRHCSKCKSLFYGPEESSSRCPVGAQHDGSQSHDFTLRITS